MKHRSKLLPYIVAMPRWRLKARIRLRGRILAFTLNDKNAPPMPEIELKIEPYDSDVEEDFYRRFSKAGSGWKILREPDPVLAGNSIMIPDFAFELNGEKVYFEIVGYWTPSYLKKKVEKREDFVWIQLSQTGGHWSFCIQMLLMQRWLRYGKPAARSPKSLLNSLVAGASSLKTRTVMSLPYGRRNESL